MKKVYFLFFSLSILNSANSQDANFLNTNQSLIYLNPSFSGSNGGIRNQFSYRNQWPILSGRYITYANSVDAYLKPLKGGIAFSAITDDQSHGMFKGSLYSFSYAQHLSLREGKLKIIPSLQVGYGVNTADINNSIFGQIFSTPNRYIPPNGKREYMDLSSGLLVNYRNFYIGASVFHINQPEVGLLGEKKLLPRYVLHASYNSHLNSNTLLNFLVKYETQGYYSRLQLTGNAVFMGFLVVGVSLSSVETPGVFLGCRNNYFSLQFGYDANLNKQADNTAGSYEMHASFNLRNKEQRKVLTNFETW